MRRVLVIEDDALIRSALGELLVNAGHDVIATEDGGIGLAEFDRFLPHAVVTDLDLPGVDGLAVIEAPRTRQDRKPWILVTSGDSPLDQGGICLGLPVASAPIRLSASHSRWRISWMSSGRRSGK